MQINLSEPPSDALERLIWLGGAREAFESYIEPMWRKAYFEARLSGRLDEAEDLGLHSHKKIMAWTRAENESRGRMIRWGDRK